VTQAIPDGGVTIEQGFHLDLFPRQDRVSAEDIISLWTAEASLSPEEAERRLGEVLLVAQDQAGGLAGVCTAYLQRNQQLRAVLWHYRIFTAAARRRSAIALVMTNLTRDHLQELFITGEDQRAIGLIYEIENDDLKRSHGTGIARWNARAIWPRADAVFIGENARGDHVRVHFFPGAPAPGPQD
jgi:hypothetical protein